jgi:replicative DNA helicase
MKLTKPTNNFEKVTLDDVLPLLSKVKKSGKNYTALCPSHSDTNNSLAVSKGHNDELLMHCFAGCEYFDILKELGLYQEPKESAKKEIKEVYPYYTADGEWRYDVVRFEPKGFAQRRGDGKGGYIWNLKGVEKLLFRLPELVNSTKDYVFVVEGERDVLNLTKLGFVATTNSGGCSKWDKSFNKYFKERDVIIIPDNDEAGIEHADTVAKNLYPIASSVRIIKLEGLAEKEDISDWIYKDIESSVETLNVLIGEADPVKFEEDELEFDTSLPSFREGEESILAAIFQNPKVVGSVFEKLEVKDFYHTKPRTVLRAVYSCFENNEPADLITVADKLRVSKTLDSIGGLAYLKEIKDSISDTLNFSHWVEIVKEKAQFRHMISLANKLSRASQGETDNPESIGQEFASQISKLKGNKIESVTHISSGIFEILEKVKNQKANEVTGLRTGFVELDQITGGLQKTDLITVAARPSMGKTAWLVQGLYNVSKEANVLLFSLEMSKEQLIKRVICSEGRVNSQDLRNNNLNTNDWARLANTIPELDGCKLLIDDTPSIPVSHIRNKLTRLKDEGTEIELIGIDYLQLMTSSVRGNRQEQVAEISRELKGLAKEFDIPVVALSQMSREVEKRNPPIPIMSDLRESGSIEQDSDVVAFLYREDYYNEHTENKGIADFIVAKNRNGETGTINLAFVKKFTRFENLFPYEVKLRV